MPFWLAFTIAEEFKQGRGASVTVLDPGWASFDLAAESLAHVDDPVVGGRVTEANAYVVEAGSNQEASVRMRAHIFGQESSSLVKLLQRSIRTRQRSSKPPNVEALGRLHGELCITHHLAEVALSHADTAGQRERLGHHIAELENFGVAVRLMLGDDVSAGAEPHDGNGRMGYGAAHLEGAHTATLAGDLQSLAGELSIARHSASLARQVASPSHAQELDSLSVALTGFIDTVDGLSSSR